MKCQPHQYILHMLKYFKEGYVNQEKDGGFPFLEELPTLAAQMAATLQCTYLPIRALRMLFYHYQRGKMDLHIMVRLSFTSTK